MTYFHTSRIKQLGSAVLLCTAMLSGAAQAASETSPSTLDNPEVGHIALNWWDSNTAPSQAHACGACDEASASPEVGHLGWAWWQHDSMNNAGKATDHLKSGGATRYAGQELGSELGHVSWQWWADEDHLGG